MQKLKLRKEKLLRRRQRFTCSAVVVDRSPCTSGIVSHFTVSRASCWRLQPYRPRKIVAEISPQDLYVHVHRAWFRTSTRQKRALSARMPAVDRQGGGRLSFEGDILADWGSWHTRESSIEEHFLHYDDFPRHCKWLTSVDRYPSTMERKLVVGIRDFCILSS